MDGQVEQWKGLGQTGVEVEAHTWDLGRRSGSSKRNQKKKYRSRNQPPNRSSLTIDPNLPQIGLTYGSKEKRI